MLLEKVKTLGEVVVVNDPKGQLEKSTHAAEVCREIVHRTSVGIQGKKYVQVEGWQSIANALGFFISADDSKREYDQKGELIGYTAKGYVRDRAGVTVGTGEGFVGLDETKTWAKRAEYACRAMAQTRAQSRAGRSVFAYIVTMIGGLETTPAEEMTFDASHPVHAPKTDDNQAKATGIKMIEEFMTKHKPSIPVNLIQIADAGLETLSLPEVRGLYKQMLDSVKANLPKGGK